MRTFLLLLCSLVCFSSAVAQPAPTVSGEGSISFMTGLPAGPFADNIDGLGYGGNIYAGVNIANVPVSVGLDLGFVIYGRNTERVPFSRTVGPAVTVDVVTTNSIVQPHLVLRFQPERGLVRPYLDGYFGFKYLFTQTRVEDDNTNDEPIASTTNFDDIALSTGAGAGVHIRLYDASTRPLQAQGSVRGLYLKLGVQYLWGQEAEYLDEGALNDTNQNGQLDASELDIRRSTTSLITPMIGIALQF
ncbi:outer membrane beta-barrel protein [Salisaeta longa]|uniref:outer membrane beta-barrel protein n=1 Tax=Salisaeta longa TaxID=503170 RepID=UPI0003B674A8|nr:outer membrane beta-barrel protein [Salisaeta longa]